MDVRAAGRVRVRRERPGDVPAAHAVHAAAFARPELAGAIPFEALLLDALRREDHLLAEMTLVAVTDDPAGQDVVVGHVAASRATVDAAPVVALGPIGVLPAHQSRGIGRALVTSFLAEADECDEPVVVLLGDPALYERFGFVDSRTVGIAAPDESWGAYFQARPLLAWASRPVRGTAAYAPPFG